MVKRWERRSEAFTTGETVEISESFYICYPQSEIPHLLSAPHTHYLGTFAVP